MSGNSNGEAASDLAFFHAFMDNSPAVCFMKDAEGRMVYINRTFERLFNVTREQMMFTTDHDWLAPVVAQQNIENDRRVIETGETLEITEVVPTPDEAHVVWRVTKFPFRDGAGNLFVGGIAIDVTEMEETKRDLAETVKVLQAQKSLLMIANGELEAEVTLLRSRA